MAGVLAGVFAERGCSSLVFRGDDGLDELTTTGPSTVWVVREGTSTEISFDPAELGIARCSVDDLRGADAAYNARVARELFDGATGPVRDMVQLNGAALLVAGEGSPEPAAFVETMAAAYARVGEAIDSGAAGALLARWAEVSQALRP